MAIQKKKQDEARSGKEKPGAGATGIPIEVRSYSGYKMDEKPRSFELEGKKLTVLRVIKTWQEESVKGRHRKMFFRVHAHDGRMYDLARDEGTGQWTLEPRGNRG